MFQPLKAIWKTISKSDDFISAAAIFPDIEVNKIAEELKLAQEGKSRGASNQPPTAASDFDSIEYGIIDRVGQIRQQGLGNYEAHRRIYDERLRRADQTAAEVDIAAGGAISDFGALVDIWRLRLAEKRQRLDQFCSWRDEFRRIHGLSRPAEEFAGWAPVFMLAIIVIVCEAAINSYLFAKGNDFGLLGGMLAAVLVSLVNVGGSGLLGYIARYARHRRILWRLIGILDICLWMVLALTFNFAVAHFRDELEHGVEWGRAAVGAVQHFLASPFSLASFESWLLCGLGLIIAVVSFRKGWHTDDPYPGYGAVERGLLHADAAYQMTFIQAIDELAARRDEAVRQLQATKQLVREGLDEANHALFGGAALEQGLTAFLRQCDEKTGHLLAIYHDANRGARTEAAPASFGKAYQFAEFTPPAINAADLEKAEIAAKDVGATIATATKQIFDQFETARLAFSIPPRRQTNLEQQEM